MVRFLMGYGETPEGVRIHSVATPAVRSEDGRSEDGSEGGPLW
jgi:hypothetical protein